MQSTSYGVLRSWQKCSGYLNSPRVRQISLTGAIETGIRHSQRARDGGRSGRTEVTERNNGDRERNEVYSRRPKEDRFLDPRQRSSDRAERDRRPTRWQSREEEAVPTPHAIPYTQSDSEFIYGTFAVKAAITAQRRTIHKLYVYVPAADEAPIGDAVEKDARRAGIPIKRVSGRSWLQLIDKMCQGRPHNGYLLEASPLPVQSIMGGLKEVPPPVTNTNHNEGQTSPSTTGRRYPFYLFLDQIFDPGNLGAIIRSAYFFGVDGVILLEHNTAPLTGVAVKASAGAAEYLPLLRVKNEVAFIQKSQANGWRFYASAAAVADTLKSRSFVTGEDEPSSANALQKHPTVLVMGGEADGIRPRIARLLDETVSIGTSAPHPGIDSLNVSVAASILMREFLTPRSSDSPSNELW